MPDVPSGSGSRYTIRWWSKRKRSRKRRKKRNPRRLRIRCRRFPP
ncbi:MAG: MliC family protein [Magnetococcales bacterium]|nr:MliC family protein [Magnetococcales bacterium]